MDAEDAAEYVGEPSVAEFRRGVGTTWPEPLKVEGKERWPREMLDEAIDRLSHPGRVRDAADVL
jgi:hypothetical protein